MNETTPLLTTVNSYSTNANEFPTISSAAETLLANSARITLESLLDSYPAGLNLTRPIHAVAFRLAVILYALADKNGRNLPSMPIGQSTLQLLRTCHDEAIWRDRLENIATIVLDQIPDLIEEIVQHPDVNKIGGSSIEDVLLTSFREHDKSGNIRILDLLCLPFTPQTILKDRMIILSLIRLWKLGYPPPMDLSNPSSVNIEHRLVKLQRVCDTVTSPRVIHGVHLLGHVAYLIIMAHFILSPPHSSPPSVGLRGSLIITYSLSNIIFDFWTISALLHLLVVSSIVATISSRSTASFSDSNAYILLLTAFCVHILLLHFPNQYPTPLLLFEPSRTLPKASLYTASLRRGLFSASVFLLPLFLISAVLFSLSMSGNFFNFMATSVPPYNSRLAFIILFCAAFSLLLHFSACGLLLSASVMSDDSSIEGKWDNFDATSGIDARRTFVRAIVTYYPLHPHYHRRYPPPFNLPTLLLQIFPSVPQIIQTISWWSLVGPFAFIVAGIWAWGLV